MYSSYKVAVKVTLSKSNLNRTVSWLRTGGNPGSFGFTAQLVCLKDRLVIRLVKVSLPDETLKLTITIYKNVLVKLGWWCIDSDTTLL